ncbi:PTS system mannose/fructose/sorbose family transporter subunit IID [Escherichia coli]
MVDTTQTTAEKKLAQSDIRGVFLRSNLFQGSWNFEAYGAGFLLLLSATAIRRLYPENNEARDKLFAVAWILTPSLVAAPILGVTLALEEQRVMAQRNRQQCYQRYQSRFDGHLAVLANSRNVWIRTSGICSTGVSR